MKSLISSYAAWLAKVFAVPSPFPISPLTIAKTRAAMSKGYERNVRIRTLLGAHGIPVTQSPGYQAAAAQFQKIKGKHSGQTAQNLLAAAQAKWSSPAYGLNPMLLKTIAEQYV